MVETHASARLAARRDLHDLAVSGDTYSSVCASSLAASFEQRQLTRLSECPLVRFGQLFRRTHLIFSHTHESGAIFLAAAASTSVMIRRSRQKPLRFPKR